MTLSAEFAHMGPGALVTHVDELSHVMIGAGAPADHWLGMVKLLRADTLGLITLTRAQTQELFETLASSAKRFRVSLDDLRALWKLIKSGF